MGPSQSYLNIDLANSPLVSLLSPVMFSLMMDLQGSNLNYVLAPVFIERHI